MKLESVSMDLEVLMTSQTFKAICGTDSKAVNSD